MPKSHIQIYYGTRYENCPALDYLGEARCLSFTPLLRVKLEITIPLEEAHPGKTGEMPRSDTRGNEYSKRESPARPMIGVPDRSVK